MSYREWRPFFLAHSCRRRRQAKSKALSLMPVLPSDSRDNLRGGGSTNQICPSARRGHRISLVGCACPISREVQLLRHQVILRCDDLPLSVALLPRVSETIPVIERAGLP